MLDVYSIQENAIKARKDGKEGKEKASLWTKIGSAFSNKDGSMNIYLNALPLNGKLQIRERKDKDAVAE
jgi:hypothetical protein